MQPSAMEVEKGVTSKAQIVRELNIASSTLLTWLSKAESIKEGYKTFSPKRKNMRTGNWEELESALVDWFKYARDQNAPISGTILIAKAEHLPKDY